MFLYNWLNRILGRAGDLATMSVPDRYLYVHVRYTQSTLREKMYRKEQKVKLLNDIHMVGLTCHMTRTLHKHHQ